VGQEAADEVRAQCAAFLAAHTTLTLATVDLAGAPAAAAVFYAHDAALNLYFLSEEKTEHGQNILANGMVAATIQADGQEWRAIRGMQLRGRAALVPAEQLPHAVAVYGRKFSFVSALLAGDRGLATLTGPLSRARFWRLKPAWLRLIDNTVHFGHKIEFRSE
jgi:hypothetical protein